MKRLYSIIFLTSLLFIGTKSFAQNYDALKARLLSNFPDTFNGSQIPPKTKSFGKAIINQIVEDLIEVGFDEQKAQWKKINDYILYDAMTLKKEGTTCWLVYKTNDNKIIGTYMMNTENPANNRLLHTSYFISGGNYTIKQKIHRDDFSKIICKQPTPKKIQRFY